jgi:hypothetical protein
MVTAFGAIARTADPSIYLWNVATGHYVVLWAIPGGAGPFSDLSAYP